MSLGALGKNIDVQGRAGQMIGNFQLRGRTHATALPVVVDDAQDLLSRRGSAHLRRGFQHGSSKGSRIPFALTFDGFLGFYRPNS